GAAEDAKPNTLTPREIAEGWILLFDGETTFGWKALHDSRWIIAEGMLAPQAATTGALVMTTPFNDYELSLEYQAKKDGSPQVIVSRRMDVQPKKVSPETDAPPSPSGELPTDDVRPLRVMGSGWNRLHMTVEGTRIVDLSFEGSGKATATKQKTNIPPAAASYFALAGNGFVVRNIKLKPLGM